MKYSEVKAKLLRHGRSSFERAEAEVYYLDTLYDRLLRLLLTQEKYIDLFGERSMMLDFCLRATRLEYKDALRNQR